MTTDTAIQFTDVDHETWAEVLVGLEITDTYSQLQYLRSACVLETGEPHLLHAQSPTGDVVFAFILREVPGADNAYDIITPYGYGGPIAVGAQPPVEAFHEAFDAWCADNNVVSTFVRFHPAFSNEKIAHPDMDVIELAGTIAWQIDEGRDLMQHMRKSHREVMRRTGRKATEAGLVIQRTPDPAAALDWFIPMYEENMRRKDADAFYFFDETYWDALRQMADKIIMFEGHDADGTIVAGTFGFDAWPWLHAHLTASAEGLEPRGFTNLLYYELALWGQENSFTRLHLGGGVGGKEDGVFYFKSRFDEDGQVPFHIGKLVNDADRYRELSGADTTDGFFPAYRAPSAD